MKTTTTSTHWGNYHIGVSDNKIQAVESDSADQDPSPIGQSLLDSQDPNSRIGQPMVRAGYLKKGRNSDRALRGLEPFVAVDWEEALELVASELLYVKEEHGNEAIYAGSYGWGSAGTLHRSTDNLHRFLNLFGGFTSSKGTYSLAASYAITPHVLAPTTTLISEAPSWREIAEHAELVVLFGGANVKNAHVSYGGLGGAYGPGRHAIGEECRCPLRQRESRS